MPILTTQQNIARQGLRGIPSEIPSTVRCLSCRDQARESVRERVNDDEVIVQYSCPSCRWQMTRHYYRDAESK